MKFAVPILSLGAFTLIAAAPPPREVGLSIPSAQSIQILSACIEKKLGAVEVEELTDGGVSIGFGATRTLLIHRSPTLYFNLTNDGDNRLINVHYRHPMSKKTAAKELRIVGRKCFPYELEAAGGGRLPDPD